jgi:GTP1/Obg family GTP-binding protein
LASIADTRKKEKTARKNEVRNLAIKAQKSIEKINTLKTIGAKENNCASAIKLLSQAEEYEECREIISNFDTLKSQLAKIQKVLPVVNYIEKSYKHKFKGKDKLELDSLLDALYEINKKGITDNDFVIANIFPEATDETITIEGIRNRLVCLGWKEH